MTSNAPSSRNIRSLNPKGLLIALGLPILLVGALVATLLGTGAFSRDSPGEDGSMWLWTVPTGEIARVNGLTAATDARVEIADGAGNAVQIEQNDRYLILRDLTTGKVNAIDLRTLQITGTAETAPGEGVRLALHDDRAFIVDRLQGLVTQVDPVDLSPIGERLVFPAGLVGGTFDVDGTLWIGSPREGTVVAVEPGAKGARTARTESIADPGQELSLTVLGDGVAVLNRTVAQMTTLRPSGEIFTADVELSGPTRTADISPGRYAAVTVASPPGVVAVQDERSQTFPIDADSTPLLGAAVEFRERVYVPDGSADKVLVFGLDGTELDAIDIDAGGGPIELVSAGDMLFANAVYTNNAVVIAADGSARLAPKDRDDVLGGNVPPVEPVGDEGEDGDLGVSDHEDGAQDGGDSEAPPVPEPPGPVTGLRGAVSDRAVTLSWEPAANNHAPITEYTVEGDGRSWSVAPGQRVVEIGELVNGETYEFTVTAHNSEGAGPTVTSEPLRPTAEVPDPVELVTATAGPDGTVALQWGEPNGQGLEITGYLVESVADDGTRERVVETAEPGHTFLDGELTYGRSHIYSVTTLAGDAAAEPSPNSEPVTPFNNPNRPRTVRVATDKDNAGTLNVSWYKPSDNGRDITGYRVTAGGDSITVTGTEATVSGLGDGRTVEVSVVAVNEAGESPAAAASGTTIDVPRVTTWHRYQCQVDGEWKICRDFEYDDGGGNVTCEITWDGETTGPTSCASPGAIGFIPEGDPNPMRVRIWNDAGSDAASTQIEWM
ncbi:fibronectin type III domain-containing protein [Glycomyces halotolerans]